MNMMFEEEIDVTLFSEDDQREMLRYYRECLKQLDLKLKTLQDGTHTIMSKNGIELLQQIRSAYWRRIQTLQASINKFKKGRN